MRKCSHVSHLALWTRVASTSCARLGMHGLAPCARLGNAGLAFRSQGWACAGFAPRSLVRCAQRPPPRFQLGVCRASPRELVPHSQSVCRVPAGHAWDQSSPALFFLVLNHELFQFFIIYRGRFLLKMHILQTPLYTAPSVLNSTL